MKLGLLNKLRACKHTNTNAFDYVRNDGLLSDIIHSDNYGRREDLKSHLTGMRFCLDCGATQRYKLRDPLAILGEAEPWMAPWLWRKL